MIISDKHKYVFIQIPRTGSTAIGKELREKYGGKDILDKHSNHHQFLRHATPRQKKYFVFAAVRNPLDDAVTHYSKFLTNHDANYTDSKLRIDKGGWVSKRRLKIYKQVQTHKDFSKFLQQFYPHPYTSNININKKHCDFILRFEDLDKGFSEVLEKLGIEKQRPLPYINKTKRKNRYSHYYSDASRAYAAKVFGPFMREWGYQFPADWAVTTIPFSSQLNYWLMKKIRTAYSRFVQAGPLKEATFIRNLVE